MQQQPDTVHAIDAATYSPISADRDLVVVL